MISFPSGCLEHIISSFLQFIIPIYFEFLNYLYMLFLKQDLLGLSVIIGPNFKPRGYFWYGFHAQQDQWKWAGGRV